MKVLLLRFDAPLVSFGAPTVDHNGVVQRFPARSMLTGLIANAFGWTHGDANALDTLQDRLGFAARIDRRGEELVDYQTVDLGLPWMLPTRSGWTSEGRIARRTGASSEATHQRWRHYRADSVTTVALVLSDGVPTLQAVEEALKCPARPLFIGRKCCLPASRILQGTVDADSPLAALVALPRLVRGDTGPLPVTWWDADDPATLVGESRAVAVTDERDWANQIHVGRRMMREALIDPPEVSRG